MPLSWFKDESCPPPPPPPPPPPIPAPSLAELYVRRPPQRWDAVYRRVRLLTRTGVVNFATALLRGDWSDPVAVASLDEAELIALYQAGPLHEDYVNASTEDRYLIDKTASAILGDNPQIGPNPAAPLSGAGVATYMALVAHDGMIDQARP